MATKQISRTKATPFCYSHIILANMLHSFVRVSKGRSIANLKTSLGRLPSISLKIRLSLNF